MKARRQVKPNFRPVGTSFGTCFGRALGFALAAATLLASGPVQAAEIQPADVEAAVRSLGFVDNLQGHTPIVIGVVFKQGDADSKAAAQRIAGMLAGLAGPNGAKIAADIMTANELGQGNRRVDVLYIVPGAVENNRAVGEVTRRQHVVSISNDPACLTAQCCMLMVRAGARTEIVLDTALACESGATFSSVFMMMVKRK